MVTIDLKCCEPQIVRNKFYLLLKVPCRLLHLSFKQLLLCFLCKHVLTSWAWRLQVQSFPWKIWSGRWSLLLIDSGPIRSSKWVFPLGMFIFNNSFFRWSCSFHVWEYPRAPPCVCGVQSCGEVNKPSWSHKSWEELQRISCLCGMPVGWFPSSDPWNVEINDVKNLCLHVPVPSPP